MEKDELIKQVARLVAGLQVPISIMGSEKSRYAHLGVAYDAWKMIKDDVLSFGWTNADDVERYLREKLDGG